MSERPMAERRIEIKRLDGTFVTVEAKAGEVVIGEWGRPGEEGTCSGHTLSRDWPGTKIDFTLAEELLCVVAERDRWKALAGRLREALKLREYDSHSAGVRPAIVCRSCGRHQPHHAEACELAALLADPDGQEAAVGVQAMARLNAKLRDERDVLGKALRTLRECDDLLGYERAIMLAEEMVENTDGADVDFRLEPGHFRYEGWSSALRAFIRRLKEQP